MYTLITNQVALLMHNTLILYFLFFSLSLSLSLSQISVELQKDVFHLAWSPDSLPAEEAVRPLLERLFASLSTYSAALLKNNLDRLLYLMWLAVLNALHDQIGKDTDVSARCVASRFSLSLSFM